MCSLVKKKKKKKIQQCMRILYDILSCRMRACTCCMHARVGMTACSQHALSAWAQPGRTGPTGGGGGGGRGTWGRDAFHQD